MRTGPNTDAMLLEAGVDYAELGRRLRAERMRQGLRLVDVAAAIGTESHEWISAVEQGRRHTLAGAQRIATALGLRIVVSARVVRCRSV